MQLKKTLLRFIIIWLGNYMPEQKINITIEYKKYVAEHSQKFKV